MSNLSINNAIPENALERQLYFIEKCKEHVAQLKNLTDLFFAAHRHLAAR